MPKELMINSFDPDRASRLDAEMRRMIERRQRVLGPAYKLFYETPVHVARAEGVWLYDPKGNAYLDAYNNVPAVGHCHPRVVAAISRQAAVLNTHTRYLNEVVVDYAEHLVARFPAELSQAMFTCSGSEAVDLALRVAKSFTGRGGVIVTQNAYHGITTAVAEISPSLGAGQKIGATVWRIPPPDSYRCPQGELGSRFAEGVRRAIDEMVLAGVRPAALIVDTIFSSDGIYPGDSAFLAEAIAAVRDAGGVFIADEVQAGFGRCGTLWGFERHGVTPDIVVLGKPMGNGLPIAGIVARPALLEPFSRSTRYFNTFGGNPVCCAAAQAVLDILDEEELVDRAATIGTYLRESMRSLMREFPVIGDVRGAGLFVGVELVGDASTKLPAPRLATAIVNAMRRRRVLISASGPEGHILKIRPPLAFVQRDADTLVEALRSSLSEACQHREVL